jgi:hypothetical protein
VPLSSDIIEGTEDRGNAREAVLRLVEVWAW